MWNFNFLKKKQVPYDFQKEDVLYVPPAISASYGIDSLASRGSFLNVLHEGKPNIWYIFKKAEYQKY